MKLLLIAVVGYLIGAIPFAFVIGKLFFHTDVRKHGSGNLGGSNTGRVLGKKAGVAVMTLDLLKVTLVVFLAGLVEDTALAAAVGGLSAGIGHCYPVFVRFKGGKAVAALYGFLFALWVCMGYTPMTFFVPLVTFLAVLYLFKIVSLASMISSAAAPVLLWAIGAGGPLILTAAVYAVLIIARHHENIARLLKGEENKIRWM